VEAEEAEVEEEVEAEIEKQEPEEKLMEQIMIKDKKIIKEYRDGIQVYDYSEKAIAIIGNTMSYKDKLMKLGAKWNPYLTINNKKVKGYILSKNKLNLIENIFIEDKSDMDIFENFKLSGREKNIIKCFGKDKNVIKFLQLELVNSKIFQKDLLIKYLNCVDIVNGNKPKKYELKSVDSLFNEIKSILKPDTIETYIFLIYILFKQSSRQRESYLRTMLKHLKSVEDIQKCLCDNLDDETIITGYKISDLNINELYVLPSGRCVSLDDLISHLLLSDNKNTDPTYIKSKHGSVVDPVWINGIDLNYLISEITKYNRNEGNKIRKMFDDVIKKINDEISSKTAELIKHLGPLFYFPLATNTQLENLLIKYNYPNGETPDITKIKKIIQKQEGQELDDFRVLLSFKLGEYIQNLPIPEKEALIFIGEFSGMGKEAWDKLRSGEFCVKSFGSILDRMSKYISNS